MTKDRRYRTVKILIETGEIKTFRQIFDHIPKTVVSEDFGTNYKRFNRLLHSIDDFKLKELYSLAQFFDVDGKIIVDLAHGQYTADKKSKKKK